MSKFKKGVLDKDTMSILSNGRRAHTNNDETNRKIKAEIITMNVGEYIEFVSGKTMTDLMEVLAFFNAVPPMFCDLLFYCDCHGAYCVCT